MMRRSELMLCIDSRMAQIVRSVYDIRASQIKVLCTGFFHR